MGLLKETVGDVTILRFQCDVMGGPEAVEINEEINQLLDNQQLKVVIDLNEVQRMNSSGLGILINALSTFKNNGGDLKLANANSLILHLLKITRLSSLFECYNSVDDALNNF
jgi:anti-sigma B factor antagonist